MKIKVGFTIVTAPVYIDLMCPYCDSENILEYDYLESAMGSQVYFGNHGSIICMECEKEIGLGEVEYD